MRTVVRLLSSLSGRDRLLHVIHHIIHRSQLLCRVHMAGSHRVCASIVCHCMSEAVTLAHVVAIVLLKHCSLIA